MALDTIALKYDDVKHVCDNVKALKLAFQEMAGSDVPSVATSQGQTATKINDMAQKVNSLTATLQELLTGGHATLENIAETIKKTDQTLAGS